MERQTDKFTDIQTDMTENKISCCDSIAGKQGKYINLIQASNMKTSNHSML